MADNEKVDNVKLNEELEDVLGKLGGASVGGGSGSDDELQEILEKAKPVVQETAGAETEDMFGEDRVEVGVVAGTSPGLEVPVKAGSIGRIDREDSEAVQQARNLISGARELIDDGMSERSDWEVLVKDYMYQHSEIVGYLAKDDARVNFGFAKTYVTDENKDRIPVPNLPKSAEEMLKEGSRPSDVYQREAKLDIKYKNPTGQQGLFLRVPVEAYELIGMGTGDMDSVKGLPENPDMRTIPVSKFNLITIISNYFSGAIRESRVLEMRYATKSGHSETQVTNVGEKVSELVLQVPIATGRLVGAVDKVVGKVVGRVKHSYRRSIWNPINYVPLRKFEYVPLGANVAVSEDLSEELNRWYADAVFSPQRGKLTTTYDELIREDKNKFVEEGDGKGRCSLFDPNDRTIVSGISHWGLIDENGDYVVEEFKLPKKILKNEETGRYQYVAKRIVRDSTVEGFDPKLQFSYEDDPQFDKIKQASEGTVDYDLIMQLQEEFKSTRKSSRGTARSTVATKEEAAILINHAARLADRGEYIVDVDVKNKQDLLTLIRR